MATSRSLRVRIVCPGVLAALSVPRARARDPADDAADAYGPRHEDGQADQRPGAHALAQDEDREGNGDQDAELVDGHDDAGEPVLEGPEVAQPGGAGGQARGDEAGEAAGVDGAELADRAAEHGHGPHPNEDDRGAQGCGEGGVGGAHALLGQDGGQSREQESHGNHGSRAATPRPGRLLAPLGRGTAPTAGVNDGVG